MYDFKVETESEIYQRMAGLELELAAAHKRIEVLEKSEALWRKRAFSVLLVALFLSVVFFIALLVFLYLALPLLHL